MTEPEAELYDEMKRRFFSALCFHGRWELPAQDRLTRVSLWDRFVAINPEARKVLQDFQDTQKYELSELQCSTAVGAMLRIWRLP